MRDSGTRPLLPPRDRPVAVRLLRGDAKQTVGTVLLALLGDRARVASSTAGEPPCPGASSAASDAKTAVALALCGGTAEWPARFVFKVLDDIGAGEPRTR